MASSRVALPRTLWPVIREPAAPGAPAPWSIEPEDATFKLSEPARTLYRREHALIEAWTAAAVNAWPATTMRALAQTLRADRAMVGAKIEAEVSREAAIEPGGGPNIAKEASEASTTRSQSASRKGWYESTGPQQRAHWSRSAGHPKRPKSTDKEQGWYATSATGS